MSPKVIKFFFWRHKEWDIISKSRGGILVNGVPREVPNYIHHDTPKAFPYIVILSASQTRKEGFLLAKGRPREYHGAIIQIQERAPAR